MQISLKPTGFITYVTVLSIVVFGSMFSQQLLYLESLRAEWINSTFEPSSSTNILDWAYSLALISGAFIAAWFLYRLYWRSQFSNVYKMVVIDDYDEADYKLIPKEEYNETTPYIPDEIKEKVKERDGMKCQYTGRNLHEKQPGIWSRWLWKKTKDSNKIPIRMLSFLVRSPANKLSYDHVVPRRLKGETSEDNLVLSSLQLNSTYRDYLRGKKLVFAVYWCYERGKTIHKDAIR